VGGRGIDDDLFGMAEALDGEPIDADRPPWQIILANGLSGGRQAAIMRLHHSYTDGLGAVRLAGELFDLGPGPAAQAPASGGPASGSGPGGPASGSGPGGPLPGSGVAPPHAVIRAAGEVGIELRRHAGVLARTLPWAARSVRDAVVDPRGRAGVAAAVARSLVDQLGLAATPASPLLAGRSPGVHFAAIDLDLDGLRRAGARASGAGRPCTVNDVFVAGLLGGLDRYHAKHRSRHPGLRVWIPISARSEETGYEMRNQLQGTFLVGPLGVDDPFERTRLVHDLVAHARGQPFVGLIEDLSILGARLPYATEALGRATRGLDVLASNVPGPPAQLFLAGARVDRLIPFGPRGGSALNATLLSYNGSVHIGVNVDPSAARDAPFLLDCLRSGFEDLLIP
jgi:WS/DGAT/MGAT family acyltransferase